MKAMEIFRKLKELNRPFYSISDLEKITGSNRNSLYVRLNGWVRMGILERIGNGLYIPGGEKIEIEKIAMELYPPCYLSFESALSRYGILNLIPYTLTFATSRKTKKWIIAGREIIFRKIKKDLFWGYEVQGGIYIASPEKAFIDQIYFFLRGKAEIDLDEIDLKRLNRQKVYKIVEKFPPYVKRFIKNLENTPS